MARLIPGILLTVIAVLLIVLATSRETEAQLGGNGRYQIVHAGEVGRTLSAWRIDSRTGTVSLCAFTETNRNGKTVSGTPAHQWPVLLRKSSAEGGDRTRTGLRPRDFKSCVNGGQA